MEKKLIDQKEIDFNDKNYNLIKDQNNFFHLINEISYEKKMFYFIKNNIVTKQYTSDYYFNLPFKIFGLLFQSFTQDSVKLTNSLSIPKDVWNNKYFDLAQIENVPQKKKIFILLSFRIEMFLLNFKEKRKVTYDNIEKLCKEMQENLLLKNKNNKSININLLKFEYNNYNTGTDIEKKNLEMIKSDIEKLNNKSYMDIVILLIQNAMRMNEVLKISNMNNYDYLESQDEREELKSIQNGRIILTRFFSLVILKIIIDDLYKVILFYLNDIQNQETNEENESSESDSNKENYKFLQNNNGNSSKIN